MRHPTSANQVGESVSEAVVHSANINLTAQLGDKWVGYVETYYNPEQNFAAASSITGLPRNNINMRRAYVMYNGLKEGNFYASLGKMDIPFGLNDTVSPFTNSTNWHSFAGLAYGATAGFVDNGLHVRVMAVQGGAQFRNANTPVKGSNVPSRLNNFAVDINYTADLKNQGSFLSGISYQHGTSYCQAYPIKHFEACEDNNPGIAVYAKYVDDRTVVLAEYAQTLNEWPGTFNPSLPQFEAEQNTTFTLGFRRLVDLGEKDIWLSAEFSRFKAGDDGAPWEKSDQFVLGASHFVGDSVNLFGEYVHVDGWAPLNFLSGGNCAGGLNPLCVNGAWSEQGARTDVFLIGVQAAF